MRWRSERSRLWSIRAIELGEVGSALAAARTLSILPSVVFRFCSMVVSVRVAWVWPNAAARSALSAWNASEACVALPCVTSLATVRASEAIVAPPADFDDEAAWPIIASSYRAFDAQLQNFQGAGRITDHGHARIIGGAGRPDRFRSFAL